MREPVTRVSISGVFSAVIEISSVTIASAGSSWMLRVRVTSMTIVTLRTSADWCPGWRTRTTYVPGGTFQMKKRPVESVSTVASALTSVTRAPGIEIPDGTSMTMPVRLPVCVRAVGEASAPRASVSAKTRPKHITFTPRWPSKRSSMLR